MMVTTMDEHDLTTVPDSDEWDDFDSVDEPEAERRDFTEVCQGIAPAASFGAAIVCIVIFMFAVTMLLHGCQAAKGAQLREAKPTITGEWDAYTITQRGERIDVDNPGWIAVGEMRGDVLRLTWVCVADGRAAPGHYRLEGRHLVGEWGYIHEVTRDHWNGRLYGCGVHEHTMTRRQ